MGTDQLEKGGAKTANILTNGTQEDTFSQSADEADYDVTINDNQNTVALEYEVARILQQGDEYQFFKEAGQLGGSDVFSGDITPDRVRVESYNSGSEIEIKMEDKSNNTVYSDSSVGGFDTGWQNIPSDLDILKAIDHGGNSDHFKISLEFTIQTGHSIGGVSKSAQ